MLVGCRLEYRVYVCVYARAAAGVVHELVAVCMPREDNMRLLEEYSVPLLSHCLLACGLGNRVAVAFVGGVRRSTHPCGLQRMMPQGCGCQPSGIEVLRHYLHIATHCIEGITHEGTPS